MCYWLPIFDFAEQIESSFVSSERAHLLKNALPKAGWPLTCTSSSAASIRKLFEVCAASESCCADACALSNTHTHNQYRHILWGSYEYYTERNHSAAQNAKRNLGLDFFIFYYYQLVWKNNSTQMQKDYIEQQMISITSLCAGLLCVSCCAIQLWRGRVFIKISFSGRDHWRGNSTQAQVLILCNQKRAAAGS